MLQEIIGTILVIVGLIWLGTNAKIPHVIYRGVSIPGSIIVMLLGSAIAGWIPWFTINLGI